MAMARRVLLQVVSSMLILSLPRSPVSAEIECETFSVAHDSNKPTMDALCQSACNATGVSEIYRYTAFSTDNRTGSPTCSSYCCSCEPDVCMYKAIDYEPGYVRLYFCD